MDDWPRIVAHADMDAFYAAVEQLDDPALRDKPVLVGPKSARGVVLTASYEARPYGISSAMSVGEALRRCPQAIIVGPRMERYQEISARVMDTLANFSPRVEALSMDEAFVEMTGAERLFGSPHDMGIKIKRAVRWLPTYRGAKTSNCICAGPPIGSDAGCAQNATWHVGCGSG